jgi:hypothetical protein
LLRLTAFEIIVSKNITSAEDIGLVRVIKALPLATFIPIIIESTQTLLLLMTQSLASKSTESAHTTKRTLSHTTQSLARDT